METITLGGGCFWCIEAILKNLKGVQTVVSGFSGGTSANPTYQEVCNGDSGYVEVVQVVFDPSALSLHDLLTIFFTLHNPTTLNQQGADKGEQYRSVVFYGTEEQQKVAKAVIEEFETAKTWPDPIVTTLEPFTKFYPAEDYHQDYYERNSGQFYCQAVIAPKVAKLRKLFYEKLTETSSDF